MAILPIIRMGHPILARTADPVLDPTTPEMRQLVADMTETLADANGAGLAAPQVEVSLRVVIFHAPAEAGESLTVLFNPEIEALDDQTVTSYEACLSVPGLTGPVPRHSRIRYRGLGPDGETIERIADGFHARVVQHECDHLDGILYPMRMPDLGKFGFVEEVRRRLAHPST